MGFIENLEQELDKSNITVYKLCKEIGVSPNTVSNYKNGTIPKIDIVEKISLYLGITTDKLILGKEPDELTVEERKIIKAYKNTDKARQEIIKEILKLEKEIKAELSVTKIG